MKDKYTPKDIVNTAILLGILIVVVLTFPKLINITEHVVDHFVDAVVIPDIQRGNDGPFGAPVEEFMKTINSDRVKNSPARERKKAVNAALRKFTTEIANVVEAKATTGTEKRIAAVYKKALAELADTVTSSKLDSLSEDARDKAIDGAINKTIADIAIVALPEILVSIPEFKSMIRKAIADFTVRMAVDEIEKKHSK